VAAAGQDAGRRASSDRGNRRSPALDQAPIVSLQAEQRLAERAVQPADAGRGRHAHHNRFIRAVGSYGLSVSDHHQHRSDEGVQVARGARSSRPTPSTGRLAQARHVARIQVKRTRKRNSSTTQERARSAAVGPGRPAGRGTNRRRDPGVRHVDVSARSNEPKYGACRRTRRVAADDLRVAPGRFERGGRLGSAKAGDRKITGGRYDIAR